MNCTLTVPSGTMTLASTNVGEACSGLRISLDEGAMQVTPILRAKEPRQRDRGNRLTVVSFQSQRAFASLAEAEAEVLGLPAKLLDQTGATATLTTWATTLNLYQVAATVEASHFGRRVFYSVTLRGRIEE